MIFGKQHAEIKIVAAMVLLLVALPVMAVAVVASSGVAAVSAAIAAADPQSQDVTLYNADGLSQVVLHLETSWPAQGYVSSEFGATEAIRHELNLGPHSGIDIANASGSPIYSFMNGSVLRTDDRGLGTCGKYVQVTHDYGISSLYCHMAEVDSKPGDPAPQGSLLGKMGTTGASTGPHVHFQINVNGIPVNPRTFIAGEPNPGDSHAPSSLIPGL